MRGPQGLVCEAGRPLMWPEGVSADLCASIAIHEWTEKESGFEGEKKRRRKGKRKRVAKTVWKIQVKFKKNCHEIIYLFNAHHAAYD